jgi:hypothetical protein
MSVGGVGRVAVGVVLAARLLNHVVAEAAARVVGLGHLTHGGREVMCFVCSGGKVVRTVSKRLASLMGKDKAIPEY